MPEPIDENITPNSQESEIEKLVQQGNELSDRATEKQGAEADRLYEQAYEKYKTAIQMMPDEPDIYYNWAIALTDQAISKTGEESDKIFQAAYEKYKAALDIEPADGEVWHNWGTALMDQAEMKDGEDTQKLLEQAKEKLIKADQCASEYSAYQLAIIAAVQGDEDGIRKWLETSLNNGDLEEIVDKSALEEDPLFESVLGKDWFKDILDRLD